MQSTFLKTALLILIALCAAGCSVRERKDSPPARALYAYDAGGIHPRGEVTGFFTIQDTVATIQPGPGGPIPDTLLIVAPMKPPHPGQFTIVDTVFEVMSKTRTDTTLLVRPH